MIHKIFLGLLGSVILFCLLGSMYVQAEDVKPTNDPVWIKVGRVPPAHMSVYFDFTSIKREGNIASGLLMYVPDEPMEELSDKGEKKLAAARVSTTVVDCKEHIFGVLRVQLFEVNRPTLKDVPFKTKVFDEVTIQPMAEGSPLDVLFCPNPKFAT